MANIESVKLPNGSEYNIKDAISGYALQSEMSVTDGTGTDADKTTIQLKSGTSVTVLKTHQSISGKADKVTGGTNGNLASLDGNGNLTDAGVALNISTPSNGQLMKYNGISGKWENADAPASAPMPNLLDNPWFTVNQRGVTSGNATSEAYTVDQWRANRINYNFTSSGCALYWNRQITGGYLQQALSYNSDWIGKTFTFSAIIDDNLYSTTFTMQATEISYSLMSGINAIIGADGTNRILISLWVTTTTSHTIKAVKLELGSQSTLALDTAPDYTTELLKCQRYFYNVIASVQHQVFGFGVAINSTDARIVIELPTQMRTAPTFSSSGTFNIFNGSTTSVTSMSTSRSTSVSVEIEAATTGLSTGSYVRLSAASAGATIAFSSEL